jgi:hypothetical protein
MAKIENKRVVSLGVTSIAMFQGTFAGVIGFGVAILHSLRATVDMAGSTESVLAGMAFGLATGIVSILVVPLVYFALGWVVGLIQGWVYNTILGASGGIVLGLKDE